MPEAIDYNALSWVRSELAETLEQARARLEEYVADRSVPAPLQQCATQLHEAVGPLNMVGLKGAILLTSEMEEVVTDLLQASIDQPDTALEFLMQGFLQLPDYLASVKSGRQDRPQLLLPLINSLRATRGEQPLEQAAMFSPNLSARVPESVFDVRAKPVCDDVAAMAKAARVRFQGGLLEWYRNADSTSGLQTLAEVLEHLRVNAASEPVARVWWVGSAIAGALVDGSLDATVEIKQLFGHIDRQIKRLMDAGEAVFDDVLTDDLVKRMLYTTTFVSEPSPVISQIREVYGISHYVEGDAADVESDGSLVASNDEMREAVAATLRLDLEKIRDLVDQYREADVPDPALLSTLIEQLHAVSNTLAMIDLESQSAAVSGHVRAIREAVDSNSSLDDEACTALAGSLVDVEAAMNCIAEGDAGNAALGQSIDAVTREVVSVMGMVKETMSSFIQSPGERGVLGDVPGMLSQVAGGLMVAGQDRAAAAAEKVASYVGEQLVEQDNQLGDEAIDALADAICSIEFFVEEISENRSNTGTALDVAEESLAKLGYPSAYQAPQSVETGIGGSAPAEHLEKPGHEAPGVGSVGAESQVLVEQEPAEELQLADVPMAADAEPAHSHEPATDLPVISSMQVIDPDADEEILEIFIEEAGEELQKLSAFIPMWVASREVDDYFADIRRSFHTLKGSGRMVGALAMGECAWQLENLANRIIEGSLQPEVATGELFTASVDVLTEMLEQVKGERNVLSVDIDGFVASVASGRAPEAAADQSEMGEDEEYSGEQSELTSQDTAGSLGVDESVADIARLDETVEEVVDTGLESEVVDESIDEASTEDALPILTSEADPEIVEIFLEEAAEEIESISVEIPAWIEQSDDAERLANIRRSMHTLKGSGRMAGAMRLGEFAWAMEDMLNTLIEGGISTSSALQGLVSRLPEAFSQLVAQVGGATADSIDIDELMTWATSIGRGETVDIGLVSDVDEAEQEAGISEADAETDRVDVQDQAQETVEEPSLLDIFTVECADHLQAIETFLADGYESRPATDALYRALHTVSGISESAGVVSVSQLAGSLNEMVDAYYHAGQALTNDAIQCIGECTALFRSAVSRLPDMSFNDVEYNALHDRIVAIPALDEFTQEVEPVVEPSDTIEAVETVEESQVDAFEGMDQELYEIFVEEATEIIEASEATLRHWIDEPENAEHRAEFQRQLHTIKGGARMVDITAIGDLSHGLESLITRITDGLAETSDDLFALLQESHDRLSEMVEQVRQRAMPAAETGLQQRIDIACGKQPEEVKPDPVENTEDSETVAVDEVAATEPVDTIVSEHDESSAPGQAEASAVVDAAEEAHDETVRQVYNTEGLKLPQKVERKQKARVNSEQVRVQSNVLDDMVNFAGEINIYRSRMEQQVSDYRFNLAELDQTIARLRDQLRQLEMETEAQILYRFEQEVEDSNQDFDPLEMDRYSNLQQLSRSLIESISDLRSLQELMDDTTRESETLLLQQSRVSTDLQEGLMRTRMIPFSGLSSRLRRIVRQSARQLGKKVELELVGADGEMDRTVIDRVVAPLEHMLRNAVAHGVEVPETRKTAGKPAAGTITITFDREGPEIVLKIEDDGAGINIEAIRERAIERGLMTAEDELSDNDVMQFILQTGFSTAAEVTQISGRGVGMDVVNSEVKQLGGSLHIESTAGMGTLFTVRLPYTLAINQALLARAGSESFCVPLGSVEGVVRSNTEELFACYRSEDCIYHYAGNAYQLKHLGTLLGTGGVEAPEAGQQVPVLLVRIGEKRIALQVESLLGSREIVIKPVGAQLSTVDCISGATILGDGSVVMILDMASVSRMNAQATLPETTAAVEQDGRLSVMVVDDSITVRKVTSRLLERNGYRVLTAKDGVDAMGQLQDVTPDMMLLDIEMPRMDGFELATHMRNDDRMRHIPIIMITSRTGDKHRERAMQIGVNNYLGKPYQESDLLDSIHTIIGVSTPGAVA